MKAKAPLLTTQFLLLCAVLFLTYCNIALFFQFSPYLISLGISPAAAGVIIGLFALTALVVRPIISPLVHPGVARKWLVVGTIGVIGGLICYSLTTSLVGLALVRVVHGAFYCVLATAVMAIAVALIPPGRSGEAFGLISVITLLPYAVLPPMVPALSRIMGGLPRVLVAAAVVMGGVLVVAKWLRPPVEHTTEAARLKWAEAWRGLLVMPVGGLMVLCLVVFGAFAPLFYFLKPFGTHIGVSNPGWFFTLSTFTEMAVRVVGGRAFDRLNKWWLLCGSLAGLGVCYGLLVNVGPGAGFILLGLGFGICWGVALPMLNALIFDFSPPRLRAFNANMTMQMLQGGFFLGPVVAGWVIAGWGYGVVFWGCAVMMLLSAIWAGWAGWRLLQEESCAGN